jgi:hypothetical protein
MADSNPKERRLTSEDVARMRQKYDELLRGGDGASGHGAAACDGWAIPITMKRDDGIRYLVGLRFENAAEAEQFVNGLSECCDGDGRRLFFKRPWQAITQDTST